MTKSTSIATRKDVAQNVAVILSDQDIHTLVAASIIPKDCPAPVIGMFARYCHESGLSPFKRQVHLVKRGDKFTIQTGIDGYRSIADRTGRYAGNDDYLFDENLSEYQHISTKRGNPTTATSIVYKVVGGVRSPFSATARWSEYCPGQGQDFMWKKMPYLMLGKCAEALALRKAFPDELGGVYTDEEMQQAGGGVIVIEHQETVHEPKKIEPISGVTVGKEFDPTKEFIEKGKYAGVEWSMVPADYLQWASKNTSGAMKIKAEAALKFLELASTSQDSASVIDDMFNQEPPPEFADPVPQVKPQPKQETPILEIIEHELDEIARKMSVKDLIEWGNKRKPDIQKLAEKQRALIIKSWNAALSRAKKTVQEEVR